jgi:hypothetical protein
MPSEQLLGDLYKVFQKEQVRAHRIERDMDDPFDQVQEEFEIVPTVILDDFVREVNTGSLSATAILQVFQRRYPNFEESVSQFLTNCQSADFNLRLFSSAMMALLQFVEYYLWLKMKSEEETRGVQSDNKSVEWKQTVLQIDRKKRILSPYYELTWGMLLHHFFTFRTGQQ